MPDLPLRERRQLTELESALLVEVRRSNDNMAAEFRRLADHWIEADDKTDPKRRSPLVDELDSWPMRLRVLAGKLVAGTWDNFRQPIATLITLALAYYGLKFTNQNPTPSPVQVQQVVPTTQSN